MGNRVQGIEAGVTTQYQYDANDRISQQGGVTYTYDANGNTLEENDQGGITRYLWNSRNEMVRHEAGGFVTDYQYNAEGIRHSQSDGVIDRTYLVDANRSYAQVLAESVNGSLDVAYHYGDDLISQNRSGNANYFHVDGLGSTRVLTDASGNQTDRYGYAAFGEVLAQDGVTDNDYLYTGEQFDENLDQYYLRARYYDQGVGRFSRMDDWMGVNFDPVTLHKYLYANVDSVNNIDPTGNFSLGGFGATSNIQGILAKVNFASIAFDIFSLATSDEELSARDIGTNILLTLLPAKHVLRVLNKACKIGNSFVGGTLVRTEYGLIPIEDVEIGMRVLSFNEETGTTEYQEVIHLIAGEGSKELVDIELSSGDLIIATGGHPFYVNNIWVNAENLTTNQNLFGSDELSFGISSLRKYNQHAKVYNLTVAKNHTYFVGRDGALSHNSNCFKLKSRIKENPRLAKEAEKAGKDIKIQKDLDALTAKLGEGNLNPGIGTKPIGKGISEARSRDGARVYFRVVKGAVEILGKSSKANQDAVIKEVLKTFK